MTTSPLAPTTNRACDAGHGWLNRRQPTGNRHYFR